MTEFEIREIRDLRDGLLFDQSRSAFPTRVFGFQNGEERVFESKGSLFGYIQSGEADLALGNRSFTLGEGMYFCANDGVKIRSRGKGILLSNDHHRCLPSWGGPIEESGRLKYIDGCTDSLLICPTMQGDPCLNLLVFPPNIEQTPHTHPSFRAGIIARGSGYCVLPDRKVRLEPGMAWIIGAGVKHCFHSDPGGLAVIAYHPDSDWGPTHEVHPMINRTIIS